MNQNLRLEDGFSILAIDHSGVCSSACRDGIYEKRFTMTADLEHSFQTYEILLEGVVEKDINIINLKAVIPVTNTELFYQSRLAIFQTVSRLIHQDESVLALVNRDSNPPYLYHD